MTTKITLPILLACLAACGAEHAATPRPPSVVAATAATTTATTAAPAPRYTMEDLRALEAQRGWSELVLHLADVPPSGRDAAWQALAEKAAVELLTTIANDREPLDAAALADDLTKRYPTLTRSKAFMSKRAEVGIRGFDACYDLGKTGVACTERLLGFVQADPTNDALAMNAGRLVVRRQFAYAAVPFFRSAVVGKTNVALSCGDADLERAVAAALDGLPSTDPIAAQAREVQLACRKTK